MQTQTRVPLKEQSNQAYHFLRVCFHLLVAVPCGKTAWLAIIVTKTNIEDDMNNMKF